MALLKNWGLAMSELKPCPFCNADVNREEFEHEPSCYFFVTEDDDKCMDVGLIHSAWNTRATPIPEIIEQVRALQHEKSLMVSDERAAGRYDAIGDVIEILERYR